jgi:hypothetical protein
MPMAGDNKYISDEALRAWEDRLKVGDTVHVRHCGRYVRNDWASQIIAIFEKSVRVFWILPDGSHYSILIPKSNNRRRWSNNVGVFPIFSTDVQEPIPFLQLPAIEIVKLFD